MYFQKTLGNILEPRCWISFSTLFILLFFCSFTVQRPQSMMVWANPSRYLFTAAGDQVVPLSIVKRPPEASFVLPAFIMILFIRCRFRSQPGLWRRGSGGEDVLLVRLPGGLDLYRLRAFTLSLYGGDPGGAAVRWPVETLPRHWHRNDHHESRKVNLIWHVKNYFIEDKLNILDQRVYSIF